MDLTTFPTSQLAAELQRRRQRAVMLRQQRARLAAELEQVKEEIASLGDPAHPLDAADGPRRRRARNQVSLADAIAQAMEIRAIVTPTEAAEIVRANGYQSTSKNFAMMVSNTLAKDKRFKRLARGQYQRIA